METSSDPGSGGRGFRRISEIHLFSAWEKKKWQVVGKVTDGLQAIQKAEKLHPDIIVLDIGLRSLNGIEVTPRIRQFLTECKILFVSQETSADMVGKALGTGAQGYATKIDAASELLEAVNAVHRREQFFGKRFAGHDFVGASMQ